MWQTALGGLLAILGGLIANWIQLRYTRRIRMDEIIAERKVTANAQAYSHMKEIEASEVQEDTGSTREIMQKYEQWFFDNRLFLPGKFPEKWLLVRNDLFKLARWQTIDSKTPDELFGLEERISATISDAIDEVYKDMDLKRIDLSDQISGNDK